ncbi:MAG: molybdate ABC transporter substrate-binding protein [Lachnospiraceae bacterium]
MRKMKIWSLAAGMVLTAAMMTACSGGGETKAPETTTAAETIEAETTAAAETIAAETETKEAETILIAAAASLENCLSGQLIPLFEEQNPGITVEGTYDSSGKLQAQIEEGAEVDLFFSAAEKQMNALNDQGLMDSESIVSLLENKIVLIVPTGTDSTIKAFEDLADAEQVAIGDPESVPVGQYSQECLTNLGIWDQVLEKASLGTNVTEVLNWVAEGSAPAGIVYSTDAAQKVGQVEIVAEAPEGTVKPVIYPAGLVAASEHKEAAGVFLEFLQSEEAMAIFEENGFAAAK